jgi:hypothetical protein
MYAKVNLIARTPGLDCLSCLKTKALGNHVIALQRETVGETTPLNSCKLSKCF